MVRYSACAVMVMCVFVVGFTGCRSQEAAAPEGAAPLSDRQPDEARANGDAGETGPTRRKNAIPERTAASPRDSAHHLPGQLPASEIEARMRRPIEESIYDPTLDLLRDNARKTVESLCP